MLCDCLCLQVVLAGSESTVLLKDLSSQTLYHVSIFPVYEDNVGLALRGTVTTCKKTSLLISVKRDLFICWTFTCLILCLFSVQLKLS